MTRKEATLKRQRRILWEKRDRRISAVEKLRKEIIALEREMFALDDEIALEKSLSKPKR